DCPNLYPICTPRYDGSVAMWLGYHFLAGHSGAARNNTHHGTGLQPWISPQKLTDNTTLVLLADFNHWYTSVPRYALVPHGANGPMGPRDAPGNPQPFSIYVHPINGRSPVYLGAKGGNVGALDGSVRWKSIRQMSDYQIFSGGSEYKGNW